jgi:pimeloyl-ACP methyl ester carboxylesterase
MAGRVMLTMTMLVGALSAAGAGAQRGAAPPPPSPAGDPAGAFVSLPGRRLWSIDSGGTGVPVVLLHAASGSVLMWEKQLPALRAAGYRVVAFDRVGWGRSELAGGAAPGTAADDLQGLVEQLRLPRFHLVGTAAGGFVAIDYALSFPERLRSLTIASSIGGVQDPEYLALGRRLRPSPQFEALPVDVRELGPSYRAADAAGAARWLELSQRSRSAPSLPSPQTFKNRVTFDRLETLRTPSLLLTGGADLYAPPPVLQMFAARMRGAETMVVPDAGHSVFWEQPEAFNRTLLAFLARY